MRIHHNYSPTITRVSRNEGGVKSIEFQLRIWHRKILKSRMQSGLSHTAHTIHDVGSFTDNQQRSNYATHQLQNDTSLTSTDYATNYGQFLRRSSFDIQTTNGPTDTMRWNNQELFVLWNFFLPATISFCTSEHACPSTPSAISYCYGYKSLIIIAIECHSKETGGWLF